MKVLLCSVLVCIALVATAQEEEQQFYYLKITSNNCELQCFINGFPVYDIVSNGQMANQIPINLALVGKGNRLRIKAKAIGSNASFQGSIAAYKGNEIVSTDDEKAGTLSFKSDISEEADLSYNFDNERFDFSQVLRESPVMEDSSRLIDYAMKLKAWVSNNDTDALLDQMSPKINDYAAAYSVSPDLIRESMKQSFNSDIFKIEWEDLEKDEIEPIAYCDGRVWELTTASGNPLFHASTEEGSTSLRIFVANIDGNLRIVR